MAGQWFSLVSSTNKTDRHDVTEILLKVALNIITLTLTLEIMWLIQDKRFTYLFVIVPREHEGSSLSFTYLFVIIPREQEGSSLSFTYLFVIVPREHERS